jgi:hypothetical protein
LSRHGPDKICRQGEGTIPGSADGSNQIKKFFMFTIWNIFPGNGEGGIDAGGLEVPGAQEFRQPQKGGLISGQILDPAKIV